MVAMAFAMQYSLGKIRETLSLRKRRRISSPDRSADFPGDHKLRSAHPAGESSRCSIWIAGLLQTPDAGRVALADQIFPDPDIRKIPCPPQRRRIADVFQSLALSPHLTVEQNVAYGLIEMQNSVRPCGPHRTRPGRLPTLLRCRHRKPRELSGGEKQRVALAGL